MCSRDAEDEEEEEEGGCCATRNLWGNSTTGTGLFMKAEDIAVKEPGGTEAQEGPAWTIMRVKVAGEIRDSGGH